MGLVRSSAQGRSLCSGCAGGADPAPAPFFAIPGGGGGGRARGGGGRNRGGAPPQGGGGGGRKGPPPRQRPRHARRAFSQSERLWRAGRTLGGYNPKGWRELPARTMTDETAALYFAF